MAGNRKTIPAVGSTATKPPIPPVTADLRLTIEVVRVKFGGTVPSVEEKIADASVEVVGQFTGKTASNGRVTTPLIPPGQHTIKVNKAKHGPVPVEPDFEFKPDTTVIEKQTFPSGNQTVKIQMSDGSGAVVVNTFDGPTTSSALGECEVELVGVTKKNTDKTGSNIGRAVFEHVRFGKVKVKARKTGYGPIPPSGGKFDFGDVEFSPDPTVRHGLTATPEIHLTHPGNTVTKIEATIKDTPGLIAAPALAGESAAPAGSQRLPSSTSNVEALATNKPIVIVRGSNDITLTATTNPAGKAVDWKVKLNENKGDLPTITPAADGKSATLKCDKTGSFSVIAADGESKIIWNVVFVHVKVDTASSVVNLRNTGYADNNGGANFVSVRSGPSSFAVGTGAMEATVEVKLVGGGSDAKLGTDKIDLHILQSGVADTFTGSFIGPPPAAGGTPVTGSGVETPPNLPIVDANGPGGGAPSPPNSPLIVDTPNAPPIIWIAPGSFQLTNLGNQKFKVGTLDSPVCTIRKQHGGTPPKAASLRTVSGINGFRVAVCATSQNAVNNLVVQADLRWQADFSGNVTYPAGTPAAPALVPNATVGTWVGTTNGTTGGSKWSLISDATGGQDAAAAGFRITGPRFNSAAGSPIVFT